MTLKLFIANKKLLFLVRCGPWLLMRQLHRFPLVERLTAHSFYRGTDSLPSRAFFSLVCISEQPYSCPLPQLSSALATIGVRIGWHLPQYLGD